MVAELILPGMRWAMALEPMGSADWMYSSVTIFSICFFRSVNSIIFSVLALHFPEC